MQYGLDPVVNAGLVTVSTGYDAAATTIVLATGEGANLPDPATTGAYNLPWWDSTVYGNPADDANYEIVRVTARSSDTLTVTRGQEGTSASTKNTALSTYRMGLTPTKKTINDIETLGQGDLYKNAVINPEFYFWKNVIPTTGYTDPANEAVLADQWELASNVDGGTDPTLIFRRGSLTSGDIFGSSTFLEINASGAGSGYGANAYKVVITKIKNGVRTMCGAGKYVTVSFWAKSDVATKKIGVYAIQQYGTGGSPSSQDILTGTDTTITLTSTWTQYVCTFTCATLTGKTFGSNEDDTLLFGFTTMWGATFGATVGLSSSQTFVGSGYTLLSRVQVSAGAFPTLYTPRSKQVETFLNTWDQYPDSLVRTSNASYLETYSDDIRYTILIGSTRVNFALYHGYELAYGNGTSKTSPVASALWALGDVFHGIVIRDGYIYTDLHDNGAGPSTRIYRCKVTDDINDVANWTQLTISGTALTSTSYLVGYGNGYFWVAQTGVGFVPYSLSGTTLTSSTTVTVTGATYSSHTRVNDSGIYVGNWGAAPHIQLADFTGTLDPTRQCSSASGLTFAYPTALYGCIGANEFVYQRIYL